MTKQDRQNKSFPINSFKFSITVQTSYVFDFRFTLLETVFHKNERKYPNNRCEEECIAKTKFSASINMNYVDNNCLPVGTRLNVNFKKEETRVGKCLTFKKKERLKSKDPFVNDPLGVNCMQNNILLTIFM